MVSSSIANEAQQQIRQICLRLLARREHSQRELSQKLGLRGFSKQDISLVLADIQSRDWQNNDRFTESFVRQRLNQGYGPLRIDYDLRQRGIDNFNLEPLVADCVGGWQQLVLTVYQGKYDNTKHLTVNEWLKRSRFLLQRGFTHDMIKVLKSELNIRFHESVQCKNSV